MKMSHIRYPFSCITKAAEVKKKDDAWPPFLCALSDTRGNLSRVSASAETCFITSLLSSDNHTCQLPIGAGHCQWGGLTDRNRPIGCCWRDGDLRKEGRKARK